MIRAVVNRWKQSSQLRESLGVFGVRILSQALAVATGYLLARGLGPSDYGIYAYSLSIISILSLVVQLGFPRVILREAGKAQIQGRWNELKGLRRFTFCWALVVGGAIALGVGGWTWLRENAPGAKMHALALFAPFLILAAWVNIQISTLHGLRRVVLALFPITNVFYGMGLVVILVLTNRLTLPHVSGLLLWSYLVGVFVFQWFLSRILPHEYRSAKPYYAVYAWFASALPIFLSGSLFRLNAQADILMLGMFRSNEEIGIYRLAVRLASFVSFPLLVANASIGPRIVSYYLRGEMEALARWIRRMIRAAFVAAVGVWVAMFLLGRWGLGLAGEAYRAGYPALLLLGVGQLVNVAAGSVGWVLQMTHNEKDTAVGVGLALLLNVLLNALLTPRYGFMGTALATTLSLISWNVILSFFVWRRFRIRVGVL